MIMQSYDFLMLYQNMAVRFNLAVMTSGAICLAEQELIRRKLGKDASAMTITLLLNSEGKKWEKTQKGAVWLDPEKRLLMSFINIGEM